MAEPIRVLVVDDSAFMRQLLKELLSQDAAIDVVGVAADPLVAWDKIGKLTPQVLTLDVEMPRMDGLSFLEKLMRERPMPAIMVSSLTEAGCATTLRALELGAVDFVTKPQRDGRDTLPEFARDVIDRIKGAVSSRLRPCRPVSAPARPKHPWVATPAPKMPSPIVAIGASTGGTEAIKEVLLDLPADSPGIVIVQHMPPKFTRAFAERLDRVCPVAVKEAEDGDRVLLGRALIAPGDRHLRLACEGANFVVRLGEDLPVNRHRPSVDVLFRSCAEVAGAAAVGVLLTGMGEDGARGLLHMRQAGAATLAQDAETCVVFGMPRAAIALGAVEQVLPLHRLAECIMRLQARP